MVHPVLLNCSAIPNPITLVSHMLSYYIAELFPILKPCWCIPCLITLLKSSHSWNFADVLAVLLHCWAVAHLITLLRHTLSFYVAEIFPILKHCRRITCLVWYQWLIFDDVMSYDQAENRHYQVLKDVIESGGWGGVHLGITLGWTFAMYTDGSRLRLPKGVLPYLEAVDELLLLT